MSKKKKIILSASAATLVLIISIIGILWSVFSKDKVDQAPPPSETPSETVSEVPAEDPPELIDRDPTVDLKALYEINPDTIGWITVPNTDISYPIMQSTDCDQPAHDKYLHGRGSDGQYNYYGAIYADSRGRISPEGNPDNIIIYGHNMYPLNELYFTHLIRYESFDFYKQNPIIGFDTLYGKSDWKIFAVMYVNVDPSDGEVFDYIHEDYINFENEAVFKEYYSKIMERSLIKTFVDVKYGDTLLTLSTCESRFLKDARLVIFARRIREGEKHDVNTSIAAINPNPLMPDTWSKRGFGSLMN